MVTKMLVKSPPVLEAQVGGSLSEVLMWAGSAVFVGVVPLVPQAIISSVAIVDNTATITIHVVRDFILSSPIEMA